MCIRSWRSLCAVDDNIVDVGGGGGGGDADADAAKFSVDVGLKLLPLLLLLTYLNVVVFGIAVDAIKTNDLKDLKHFDRLFT